MKNKLDRVEIIDGRYKGCTGTVLYLTNENKDAVVQLDQHSMMLKLSVDWITRRK